MTITRGFLTIIMSGVAFMIGGGLIGYLLGVCMPGYYRAVFNTGRETWFDAAAVGLGLGLTQGLILGIAIGAVVVLAVAWYNARRQSPSPDTYLARAYGNTGISATEEGITRRLPNT